MVYVNITIYLNILQRTGDIFRKLSLFSSRLIPLYLVRRRAENPRERTVGQCQKLAGKMKEAKM